MDLFSQQQLSGGRVGRSLAIGAILLLGLAAPVCAQQAADAPTSATRQTEAVRLKPVLKSGESRVNLKPVRKGQPADQEVKVKIAGTTHTQAAVLPPPPQPVQPAPEPAAAPVQAPLFEAGCQAALAGDWDKAQAIWDDLEESLASHPTAEDAEARALRQRVTLAHGLTAELMGRIADARALYQKISDPAQAGPEAEMARRRLDDLNRSTTKEPQSPATGEKTP